MLVLMKATGAEAALQVQRSVHIQQRPQLTLQSSSPCTNLPFLACMASQINCYGGAQLTLAFPLTTHNFRNNLSWLCTFVSLFQFDNWLHIQLLKQVDMACKQGHILQCYITIQSQCGRALHIRAWHDMLSRHSNSSV